MTVSVKEMTFRKLPPKILSHRDHRKFYNSQFMKSVHEALFREENEILGNDPEAFFNVYHKVLNRHSPPKQNYIQGNNIAFMTKQLSKAFMQRVGCVISS